MSEHTSETIWFAIKLPNGELCADLPGGSGHNNPEFTGLPDGTWIYTWDAADDATATLHSLSLDVSHFGLTETFRELAKVVQVRITTRMEILDAVDDPIVEAEVEGLTEPRRWKRAVEAPWGNVLFRPDGLEHVGNPIRWMRRAIVDSFTEMYPGEPSRIVTADDIDARFNGFVEVLS
ncbi:hypothetical protein [Nocardia sp. NPDC049707]|uniref:hypothetical protein n=1 Tax=Nocardia sp. NPDC049707 TaxID=3154735 RepID=UPI00344AAA99